MAFGESGQEGWPYKRGTIIMILIKNEGEIKCSVLIDFDSTVKPV
jgi:hypothetical protein